MSVLTGIRAYAKSFAEADFLRETLGIYADAVTKNEVQLILFGAGSAGKNLLPLFMSHGRRPALVCDNSPVNIGTSLCDVPVVSVDAAHERHRDAVVVMAIGSHQEQVRKQLAAEGFQPDRILSIREAPLKFYTHHVPRWYWSEADLEQHADDLERAYALLSDDTSRRLFLQRIAVLSHGADYASYAAFIKEYSFLDQRPHPADMDPESFYYFNNDVVRLADEEMLVDCGAYTGDSLEQFLASKASPAALRVAYCFEPDPANYAQLEKTYGNHAAVFLYPLGAWFEDATLNFESSDHPAMDSPRSARISASASCISIKAAPLDQVLAGKPVSFIKMDIEGAEKEALRGAARMLRQYRPKLAISVYHERDDIFRIPLLIEELCPGYRFHLRLFSRNFTETVLLAIPADVPKTK